MSRLLAVTSTELVTDPSDFWQALRDRSGATKPVPQPLRSLMEARDTHVFRNEGGFTANAASAPLFKSRPVSPPVRAMLETLRPPVRRSSA